MSATMTARKDTARAEERTAEATAYPVAVGRPEARAPGSDLSLAAALPYLREDREDRKRLRAAVLIAAAIHAVLLVIQLPDLMRAPEAVAAPPVKAYAVRQVRFERPPPRSLEQQIPQQRTKKIPIPDPTPDDPEPIRELEEIRLETQIDQLVAGTDFPVTVPDGPPGYPSSGVLPVGGNVRPPEKTYFPQPRYTEEARQARIQGVVILEAIIDEAGLVRSVKVLKGLPMGLAESAVETVKQWKFKPATLEGKPVPVYFNLTVSFHLQ